MCHGRSADVFEGEVGFGVEENNGAKLINPKFPRLF
jgi:hypothetical protein